MPEKITVLAKVLVKIPESELELGLNWMDAKKAKVEAARWLRKIDHKILPHAITVLVEIDQRSDDLPFTDRGTWSGKSEVEPSIEYAAKFLTSFPTWGQGR